jgi:hypothetical protein
LSTIPPDVEPEEAPLFLPYLNNLTNVLKEISKSPDFEKTVETYNATARQNYKITLEVTKKNYLIK